MKPLFGQKVECSAYIKKSGNNYHIENEGFPFGNPADYPRCIYWEKGSSEGIEVEDYHECDRFVVVEKPFTGVFVGTTALNTKIIAELHSNDPYCADHYETRSGSPKRFAIVYYASGKKRFVPLEAIKSLNEGVTPNDLRRSL